VSWLASNQEVLLIFSCECWGVSRAVDGLCVDELSDHAIGSLWLVSGDHVARVKDFDESEVLEDFAIAGNSAVFKLPVVKISSLEFLLTLPYQGIRPPETSYPVTDVVLITIVDQHWKPFVKQWCQLVATR